MNQLRMYDCIGLPIPDIIENDGQMIGVRMTYGKPPLKVPMPETNIGKQWVDIMFGVMRVTYW